MASHLRWKPLTGTFASSLPIQASVTACTPTGETDTDVEGPLSIVACKALIKDDFSSQTISPPPSSSMVHRNPEHGYPGSSFCLSVKGGVGDAKMDRNWAMGCRRTMPAIRPTSVSFFVQSSVAAEESGVLFLTDDADRVCTVFALRKGGAMGIEDELIRYHGNLTAEFEPKKWYHVELRFDWAARSFAFLVQYSLVGDHIPFEDAQVSSLGHMYISNSYERSETWWDHFECSSESDCALTLHPHPHLTEGVWRGYVTVEQEEEDCFLRATLPLPQKQNETAPVAPRGRGRSSRYSAEESWTEDGATGSEGGEPREDSCVCALLRGRSESFDVHPEDAVAVTRCNVTGLTKDLHALLGDEETSDFCFVLQGRQLFVHKWLLSARSAHFRTMLQSGMKEAQDGRVELPDVDYKAFRAVCEFLYTGDVHLEPSMALQVLELTDRYFINDLKRLCEVTLLPQISVESVVGLLEAADRFSAAQLRAACLKFVIRNFEQVISTEAYQHLDVSLMLVVQRELVPLLPGPAQTQPAASSPEGRGRTHRGPRTSL